MKFGKTWEERVRESDKKVGTEQVFALLPKYCLDTSRYVWLEYVYKITYKCNDTDAHASCYYKENQ